MSVGEGDVGAEGDHADAGSDALAAAETRTALEFALKGSGKDNDKKIRGGVEEHGESTEKNELQENMTAVGRDELGNEGKEKQRRLRVENFGENALTKCAPCGGLRCADDHFHISRADHANAKPNKIRGTRVLDGVKCYSRGSKDCRDAKRGGQDMEETANKSAKRRKDAFTAASGEAAR